MDLACEGQHPSWWRENQKSRSLSGGASVRKKVCAVLELTVMDVSPVRDTIKTSSQLIRNTMESDNNASCRTLIRALSADLHLL